LKRGALEHFRIDQTSGETFVDEIDHRLAGTPTDIPEQFVGPRN
jgi:hypothetical protein